MTQKRSAVLAILCAIRPSKITGLQLVAVVCGLALLRLAWSNVHEAVVAIDHGEQLFADFSRHYYPTVEGSLRRAVPPGGFFYPAGFAVLIAPFGWLPLSVAQLSWAFLQCGAVLWVATRLVREAAPDRPVLVAIGALLTITSVPVLHNLKWGQVSILILGATGGAFVAYAEGRKGLAAILLGVAAGIKGYPLVFLGWFVLRGDLRFALRAAAACALTLVVLPAIAMGPRHAFWFQYISSTAVLGATDGMLRDFNSQYAPAVASRLYEGAWDHAPPDVLAWVRAGTFAALVAITALVAIVARTTAPRIAGRREMIGFVVIASSIPFWLHTSWSHYFGHLPITQTLLAFLFSRRGRATDALAIAVFVAPSVHLSNVLGLFATRGWWYYASAGSLFFANLLLLLGCTAFIIDAHVRDARPRAHAPRLSQRE